MVKVNTTPFEDLILGSQFLPIIENIISNSTDSSSQTQGVLQCRHCKESFEEEQEALIHYKLHIFEIHKSHFSIVVGDLCPCGNCIFAGTGYDVIHFHCTHCSFASKEILELPLHMEEVHLSVYNEANLCLEGQNIQLNKAYKCGECDSVVQGSISTVLHFLSHEANQQVAMEDSAMNLNSDNHTNSYIDDNKSDIHTNSCIDDKNLDNSTNNCLDDINDKSEPEDATMDVDPVPINNDVNAEISVDTTTDSISAIIKSNLVQNGSSNICRDEEMAVKDANVLPDGQDVSQKVLMTNPQLANLQGRVLLPLLLNSMKEKDKLNCELNPLMLLASLMEADQKSECPLIPTQHFLLDDSPDANHKEEDQGYLSPTSPMENGDPSPESLLNGFRDNYKVNYVDQPPGVFQCDQCSEAFKYQYQLTAHRKESNHTAKPKSSMVFPFRCHICGNEFTALSDLKHHVWSHSPDYDNFCEVCGHAFTDNDQLQDHSLKHSSGSNDSSQGRNSQSSERSNRCECCNTKFSSKAELTLHIVKYQGTCNPDKKNEGVKCATCGFIVPDLEALKKHRTGEHPTAKGSAGGKRGFDCDYCGKTFSCRSNLRDHLVVHTGEKPYPCDICGKTFSFVHNMKTHRLTHNEGRNEMCPYCDRAYKSKISLYYHMKKGNCRGLSTKEVPEGFHRCTECLQMFASEERYIQHKKKGLCQISYRCEHCGVRCSTRMKLNRHIEKGGCTKVPQDLAPPKRQSRGSRRHTRESKLHSKRSDDSSGGEVLCERCNYGRDCCCTFSCKYCGKRIFSFDAYNAHRRRHCPAKKAKERLKAAIREKALKEETEKAENGCVKTPTPPVSDEATEATPEEDSNSGSLTDLTTFTASHLLGSVSSVTES